jgi:hypothetical protein
MSDADLTLYANVVITRDFAGYTLDTLPEQDVYPVMLLAKKELYHALAVKMAPSMDLGADNNNYLRQSQRFDHYMKLIAEVESTYQSYQKSGGTNNTLTSYNVTTASRFATPYNIAKGVGPKIALTVDAVGETYIELSWAASADNFLWYKVYYSTEGAIYDPYVLGEKISSSAQLLCKIDSFRQNMCRIEELTAGGVYYVAVEVCDRVGNKAYAQKMVTLT